MAALIAFYSRAGENYFGGAYRRISVGNTEKVAEMLADLTGGELYKIEQAEPYSDDYKTCVAQAREDWQKNARPAVLDLPDDLDAYDEIYLGYPNYCSTLKTHSCSDWDHHEECDDRHCICCNFTECLVQISPDNTDDQRNQCCDK